MRLIDGNELEEKAWRLKLDSRELIAKMIENAPTIDAVPVIRCKDCKHWNTNWQTIEGYHFCYTRGDYFCADAERREE